MLKNNTAHVFVEIIREKLIERKARNKSYSLRAFARDLEMSPSHLSEILSGKHGLSFEKQNKIAVLLELDADEFNHFNGSVSKPIGRK